MTTNFADTYSPLVLKLYGAGDGRQRILLLVGPRPHNQCKHADYDIFGGPIARANTTSCNVDSMFCSAHYPEAMRWKSLQKTSDQTAPNRKNTILETQMVRQTMETTKSVVSFVTVTGSIVSVEAVAQRQDLPMQAFTSFGALNALHAEPHSTEKFPKKSHLLWSVRKSFSASRNAFTKLDVVRPSS